MQIYLEFEDVTTEVNVPSKEMLVSTTLHNPLQKQEPLFGTKIWVHVCLTYLSFV